MTAPSLAAPIPALERSPEPGLARFGPAALAVATFALHAVCWDRYGLFRDELYYMVCGNRLAVGYVDHPPGIALVARLATALFGNWVPGVRLFAWLATAVTVYLSGRFAARLSRSGAAATIASVAAFSCLVLRGLSHFLSMNAFEPLIVLGLVLVLLRLAEGEDPRLWVAAGGLAGLALLFKYTSGTLAAALLAGFVLTPARRALRTPWVLPGAAVAVLAVLPNFLWQAAHGFPFLELVRSAVHFKNVEMTPLQFVGEVLFEANPGNAPIWLGGLAWLLLAPRAHAARFAGVGGLIQLAALTFGHGKPYYVAPIMPILLGAGGAAFAAVVPSRAIQRAYCAVLAAAALVFSPVAVPILPVNALVAYQKAIGQGPKPTERKAQSVLPQVFADQLGWPELVAAVARTYQSLPPAEQAHAVVFGQNYGVASAVEILGPGLGLPSGLAISGHNNFWIWGIPSGRGDPAIVVSGPDEDCRGLYRERVLAAQLPSDPFVIPEENAHTIWICRGAKRGLETMPERLRHYD